MNDNRYRIGPNWTAGTPSARRAITHRNYRGDQRRHQVAGWAVLIVWCVCIVCAAVFLGMPAR